MPVGGAATAFVGPGPDDSRGSGETPVNEPDGASRLDEARPGLSPRTVDVDSDVTDAVRLGEPSLVRGTVFVPPSADGGSPSGILVAVPGGTYTRDYWNLVVPGHSGYSFADYFARRGHVVIALDNLGTGASSRPRDGDLLT